MPDFKYFTRPETCPVTNPEAILLLFDIRKSRWLEPFMATPCSLKDAADKLHTTMSSYSYWLKKLLAHGLIFVAFEEKRRGSPIKYYWGQAERFEFSLNEVLVEQTYGAVAEEYKTLTLASLERSLRHETPNFTASISFDVQGDLVFSARREGEEVSLWQEMLRPDAPALVAAFRDMQLSFEDAKALQKELYDLVEKYEAKVNPKERRYLVQVSLAGLEPT